MPCWWNYIVSPKLCDQMSLSLIVFRPGVFVGGTSLCIHVVFQQISTALVHLCLRRDLAVSHLHNIHTSYEEITWMPIPRYGWVRWRKVYPTLVIRSGAFPFTISAGTNCGVTRKSYVYLLWWLLTFASITVYFVLITFAWHGSTSVYLCQVFARDFWSWDETLKCSISNRIPLLFCCARVSN